MKAIYCPFCASLHSLTYREKRHCDCGHSWGQLRDDGIRMVIGGLAVPVAIMSGSLRQAVQNRPTGGMGEQFAAHVLAHMSPVVTHEDTKVVQAADRFPRRAEAF